MLHGFVLIGNLILGFFAYVDRWMTEDDSAHVEEMKRAGYKSKNMGRNFGQFFRQGYVFHRPWVKTMWQTYRKNLPPGPDGEEMPAADATWR